MRRTVGRIRNICWQSSLRQRVRTIFLLLLVGLISFAFIARAVEYLVVDREIDRLADYFRAIGYLEGEGHYDDLSAGAEVIADSKYVALEDRRMICSGVLQGHYNADVGGTDGTVFLNNIVVAYGELTSRLLVPAESTGYLTFQVDQVLAGYPEHIQEGGRISVRWLLEDFGTDIDIAYNSLEMGERYLLTAYCYYWDRQHAVSNLILRPLNDSGLWLLPVAPGTSADFSDPALTELRQEIAAIRENQRALHVIGTKDMGAIPAVQESAREYYLIEGRWLDRNDDIEGRRVAVVHRDFAELRGLALGDSITLELRNLKAPIYGYIISGYDDWGIWQEYETYTEEFKIVGMFVYPDQYHTVYTTYTYIPDSCLPVGYEMWLWWGTWYYSFVLHSPWDIEVFLAENEEALAELGMRAAFLDVGIWQNFHAAVVPMRRSAAMSAVVFSLVLVLAVSLAAFIYLRQQRRNFAILRSLGVPKSVAVRQMMQPMALVGAVGISVGGIAAWYYALGQAADTLASLQGPRGIAPSTALSPLWLAGLSAGILVLLLLFTHVGTVLTARRPVLELLQHAAGGAGPKGKAVGDDGDAEKSLSVSDRELQPASPAFSFNLGQAPAGAKNFGFAQGARYVLRHIRRARLKSLLTLAVALCFTLALGWMSWTMERNEAELERLYCTTRVEAAIVKERGSDYTQGGFIWGRTVSAILESGFVGSAYLEGASRARQATFMGEDWDSEGIEESVALRAFDQPEQFFSTSGSNISVEYAEGWDESFFTRDWTEEEAFPVLLPASILARLGLQPGDNVMISFKGTMDRYIVAGWYMGPVSGDDASPILLPLSVMEQIEGAGLLYSVAEFVLDPAKNRELPEFRAEMDLRFASGHTGTIALTFLLWDGELTNVVEPLEKNLQLMAVLFPVTVMVSVLIAAGLAVLLIFQTAKTAALLRILGTTRTRARALLCWEQVALCIVGLVLGLVTLIVLRQDASAVLMGPAMLSVGLYLGGSLVGALLSSISVTNRMPLELLQIKE